jgi:hypothetical protein
VWHHALSKPLLISSFLIIILIIMRKHDRKLCNLNYNGRLLREKEVEDHHCGA